jgi:hypothetical protein
METARLEQAIHQAVAATAAPDDARLAAILAKVELAAVMRPQSRHSAWPWLLLAAAGAAAAGGGYWYVHHSAPQVAPVTSSAGQSALDSVPPQPASPPAPTPTDPPAGRDGDSNNNAAVIYRR